MNKIFERLDSFKSDPCAKIEFIEQAKSAIAALCNQHMKKPNSIGMADDGTIIIEWKDEDSYLSIEIDKDGPYIWWKNGQRDLISL